MKKESKLIYCAVPARLIKDESSINKQMDMITKEGNAPLHPFQALPLERYENGPVGKKRTWDFCLRLVEIADELYFFGVSHGTLFELNHALKCKKPIKLLLNEWDPDWKEYYAVRVPKIKLLDDLL